MPKCQIGMQDSEKSTSYHDTKHSLIMTELHSGVVMLLYTALVTIQFVTNAIFNRHAEI